VPAERSRYRPSAPPDYSHRFHAGNVGDVWKHTALVDVLGRVAAASPRIRYLDTHAGCGRYPLGPTGEWTEGIGRLWPAPPAAQAEPIAAYLTLCRRLAPGGARPEAYPGSPLFARAVLGADAPLACWERDPTARAQLAAALDGAATEIAADDGLRDLAGEVRAAEASGDAVVVLVDPPYSQKADWTAVPDAVAAAARASTRAVILLWYPVKSLTRPNAMVARLQAAGVSATLLELITTPLEHQRSRLNGSGVLLVRPPDGTVAALAAAAAGLGPRLATRRGVWSLRLLSW
jgi:23S rRNA (adenine2030-N6)-methyltransferase